MINLQTLELNLMNDAIISYWRLSYFSDVLIAIKLIILTVTYVSFN